MPMPAGRRSTLVQIQRATETRDPETNMLVSTWGTVTEAWVSFLPLRGTEDYVDDARTSQVVVRLEGDYLELDGVRPQDRIIEVETNRIIDVKDVLPDRDYRGKIRIEGTQGEGAR